MVLPLVVTVRFVPTTFVAKEAVKLDVESTTLSPLTTPFNCAEDLFTSEVAEFEPSYSLSEIVSPIIVKVFAVMLALVVGCVRT